MHANIGPLPDDATPIELPRRRLISIRYSLLRFATAGGAVATGLIQTFVLAWILTPERFSIFIVVGAIGYTLWLADLGFSNILFVNLRSAHLAGGKNEQVARQVTAVILFDAVLALAASLLCFTVVLTRPGATIAGASELALFLLYITLNLAWTSLRNISIAVDVFVFYERLELVRRVIAVAMMLAMLAGLPLGVFLIGSNILWGVLFAVAAKKLVQRGALAPRLHGVARELVSFVNLNRRSIARSATGALSGVFIVTFPYFVVPLWFGLGAAPIILEVTFRIFRGACVIFAAICDVAIPEQTRALAARDVGRWRARRPWRRRCVACRPRLRARCCCLPPARCLRSCCDRRRLFRPPSRQFLLRSSLPAPCKSCRKRFCNSPASSAASPITARRSRSPWRRQRCSHSWPALVWSAFSPSMPPSTRRAR